MKFAVLVVIALLTASCAHAFSVGDVIWTMKRTQLGKVSSGNMSWTELAVRRTKPHGVMCSGKTRPDSARTARQHCRWVSW